QFLQLNWVFDVLFVRPEVRDALAELSLSGIAFQPALRHRSGQPLKSLLQLVVTTTLQPGLGAAGLQSVTCKPNNEEPPIPRRMAGALRYAPDYPFCGRVKHHFPIGGICLQAQALAHAPPIALTHEWFGSGGLAFRAIVAS